MAKSCLYHSAKVPIEPALNSSSVIEVLLFSSFHQESTCWKSAWTEGFQVADPTHLAQSLDLILEAQF